MLLDTLVYLAAALLKAFVVLAIFATTWRWGRRILALADAPEPRALEDGHRHRWVLVESVVTGEPVARFCSSCPAEQWVDAEGVYRVAVDWD